MEKNKRIMTNEENELLLKYLCAMLPHGLKIKYHYKRENNVIDEVRELDFSDVETLKYTNEYPQDNWCEISWKPYLRSMSSMTEEERLELSRLTDDKFKFYLYTIKPEIICYEKYNYLEGLKVLDWLNAHHFDYRGLIEKGLALEVLEGMYNIK